MNKTVYNNTLGHNNPELITEWDYCKNNPLTPFDITRRSRTKVWWVCNLQHSWQASPDSRNGSKSGCPFCSGRKAISGTNDLLTLYPEIAKEFHPILNKELSTFNILPNSGKKVWWRCSKNITHSWYATPNERMRGRGCSICAGSIVKVGINDLFTTNSELKNIWSSENTISPKEITSGSSKNALWTCKHGHTWQARISHVANGSRCSKCSPRGFNQNESGIFYLLYNPLLKARKIGICNVTSKRIQHFQKDGWTVSLIIENTNGMAIRMLETEIKRWLKINKIEPELDKYHTYKTGGWTETFDSDHFTLEELKIYIYTKAESLGVTVKNIEEVIALVK